MDLSGEVVIPAGRAAVWQALNDPDVLKACIPGCEELVRLGETEFAARVVSRVGPVSARFAGKVSLSDIIPQQSYVISGQGQGGVAGFAKGEAKVSLQDEEAGGTRLRYEAKAEVGGKLASLGSRMIQGVASKTAEDFFRAFAAQVSGTAPSRASQPGSAVDGIAPLAEAARPIHQAASQKRVADERLRWLLIGIAIGVLATVLGVIASKL